ncbi:MAG: amidohydrolase family protein [Acidimicrobiia bacterium]
MRDGRRILDADAHVIEPGGLFGAAQQPDVEPMVLPEHTPRVPVGDLDKLADFLADGCSATEYLRCMDAEGIDGVVLYPSVGLFVPFQHDLAPGLSIEACRAYNDWVAQYCATAPHRLAAVGIVPLVDVEAAAAEARRVHQLGLVGVMVRPNHCYGRDLGSPAYYHLYDVLEELGLVLAVHEGLGLRGTTIGDHRSDKFAVRHAMSHPMEQMAAMASLVLEGTLERHSTLNVAFLESGTGWLPYWLARLDGHAEWMADSETKSLSLTPSEYFQRQCVICTDPDDPLAASVVDRVGADHVMWASDFPHPDAVYPHAVSEFLAESDEHGLEGADLDAVLWDTPLRFYGLEERFSGVGAATPTPPG